MSKNENEIQIYNLQHINHHLLLAIAYQYPINTDGWEGSAPTSWICLGGHDCQFYSNKYWCDKYWSTCAIACEAEKKCTGLDVWPGCVFYRRVFERDLNIEIINNNRVRELFSPPFLSYLVYPALVSTALLDNQRCRAMHFQLQITSPDDECLLAQ